MAEKCALTFLDAGCPRCGREDKMATVDCGYGAYITTCSSCSWAIGVDDSVNLCQPDDSKDWEFEPTEEGDSVCQSNDVPHFPVFLGFGEHGLMKARCSRCHKQGIMFSTDTTAPTSETAAIDNLDNVFVDYPEESISQESPFLGNVGFLGGESQTEPNENIGGCEYSSGDRNKSETAIVCDCGNRESDCFETISESEPRQLRCFHCDALYLKSDGLETRTTSHAVCEKCSSDAEDCFSVKCDDSGNLVSIRCLVCDTVTRFPTPLSSIKHFENPICLRRERVTGWSMLIPGDHVAFQRKPAYKHHAIVTAVNPKDNRLVLIEYGSNVDNSGFQPTLAGIQKKLGCVQENEEVIENFKGVYLYRYDYDPENCYEPEEVIARARSRISEREYRLFSSNCEHFATWCKTGNATSNQVRPFLQRWLGLKLTTFINQTGQLLMDLIEHVVNLATTSADDLLSLVIGKFADMMSPTRMLLNNITVGKIGLLVLINVVVEAVMFFTSYKNARREFDTGKVSEEEFRKRQFELVGESIGGVVLGIACGLPSLTTLGIPISIILSFIGIPLGRCAGALIGRKLHSLTLKKLKE